MTIHWFFSLGVSPQPALYYRASHFSVSSERRFVTPALLDLQWPVPTASRSELRLHLLPTADLREPYRGQVCECGKVLRESAASPLDQFKSEIAAIDSTLLDRLDSFDDLAKRDDEAIWRVVKYVMESVHDGDSVVLETTNGIRSIVTGFLLASGLLIAYRKNVKVLGVTYAEFAAEVLPVGVKSATVRRGSPVFDLLPFLGLFDWSHAVRAMTQYLDPTPTLRLLQQADPGHALPADTAALLADLGAALALNFPVEIERALTAWQALGSPSAAPTPAADIALTHVGGELSALVPHRRAIGAEGVPLLDARRLDFDLALIERLIAAQRSADAARALREWIVNAVLVAWNLGAGWLKPAVRARAEAGLHGLSPKAGDGPAALKALWLDATRFRNAVSHLRYNEKHDASPADLQAFLGGAPARIRALREMDGDPFALASASAEPLKRYLANAFSLNMLTRSNLHAEIVELTLKQARAEAEGRTSVVGHADAAVLFQGLLATEVPFNRVSVKLDRGDTVLVGQYDGPRMLEGATTLPPNAKVVWHLVELY